MQLDVTPPPTCGHAVMRAALLAVLVLLLVDPSAYAAKEKGVAVEQRVFEASQRQQSGVALANTGRVAEAVKEFEACADMLEGVVQMCCAPCAA